MARLRKQRPKFRIGIVEFRRSPPRDLRAAGIFHPRTFDARCHPMDIEAADKERCVIVHRRPSFDALTISPADHMTRVFDSDLQDLARTVAEMGGLAERQITEAIEALTTRDSSRACRVIAADATIDAMQRTIEESAIDTIAQRQPVDKDLRQVVGMLRIANELE